MRSCRQEHERPEEPDTHHHGTANENVLRTTSQAPQEEKGEGYFSASLFSREKLPVPFVCPVSAAVTQEQHRRQAQFLDILRKVNKTWYATPKKATRLLYEGFCGSQLTRILRTATVSRVED